MESTGAKRALGRDWHGLEEPGGASRARLLGSDVLFSLLPRARQLAEHEGLEAAWERNPLGALPLVVRGDAAAVRESYAAQLEAGVDILVALTGDSSDTALHELGMAFRAAAITNHAIDLAMEAAERADRPVRVAGMLGGQWTLSLPPTRLDEELRLHATRMQVAGVHLVFGRVRATSRPAGVTTVRAAAATGLSTAAWVVVDTDVNEMFESWLRTLMNSGAHGLVFEVEHAEQAVQAVACARRVTEQPLGLVLGRSPPLAPQPDGGAHAAPTLQSWPEDAGHLVDAGASVLGGGEGVQLAEISSLARALKKLPLNGEGAT